MSNNSSNPTYNPSETNNPQLEFPITPTEIDEKEWFFLYWIAYFNNLTSTNISTSELIEKLQISQQTISRRIIELEQKGFLIRSYNKKSGDLMLTQKAFDQLRTIEHSLHSILSSREVFRAHLISGMGEGAYYIKQPLYLQQFSEKLGFTPFFGTLNIILDPHRYEEYIYDSKRFTPVEILGFKNGDRTYGNVFCFRAEIWPKNAEERKQPCAILRIQRTSHQPNVIEIIAEHQLRKVLSLQDQDEIEFKLVTKYENCP